MERLAADVHRIPLMPRDAVNAYLLGDVLVDSGYGSSAKRLVAAAREHGVGVHALTHAHPDHVGSSAAVAGAFGVPVWAGARDAPQVEAGSSLVADTWFAPLLSRANSWTPVPVARRLVEGDVVGPDFVVLDVPGHSAGHIAFWREPDRTLVAGDVLFNFNLLTMRAELREPPRVLTSDPARNRESARRLAALDPALVLFGHGPPLRDPERLRAFADALPA